MKLSHLIAECSIISSKLFLNPAPEYDPEIVSITSNSRQVRPGSLFIAIKGLKADGHDYIEQALENGAVAAIANIIRKILIMSC